MTEPTVIVHGGAGKWRREIQATALKGVETAAQQGQSLLRSGGSALDAVEAAVVCLEDNPIFNAGTGSVVNLSGVVENDAAIMDGGTLAGGAVALVRGVKNPIKLARIVMERTDHVLIAAKTAERLATAFKLERASDRRGKSTATWKRERLKLTSDKRFFKKNIELNKSGILANLLDTVGALALDSFGNIAAGASTGGVALKLPGRIGDTAQIGAGLYADSTIGAATATGIGELAIRTNISKHTCDLMKTQSAPRASTLAIRSASRRVGPGIGVIALDKKGRWGVSHTTSHLCWAVASSTVQKSGIKGST